MQGSLPAQQMPSFTSEGMPNLAWAGARTPCAQMRPIMHSHVWQPHRTGSAHAKGGMHACPLQVCSARRQALWVTTTDCTGEAGVAITSARLSRHILDCAPLASRQLHTCKNQTQGSAVHCLAHGSRLPVIGCAQGLQPSPEAWHAANLGWDWGDSAQGPISTTGQEFPLQQLHPARAQFSSITGLCRCWQPSGRAALPRLTRC